MATSKPIMETTTSNSMIVKPLRMKVLLLISVRMGSVISFGQQWVR